MAARSITNVYAFPVRSAPVRPGFWARLADAVDKRRTQHMLADMDDRMLADIGMNQGVNRPCERANWPAWDVSNRGW